MWHEMILRAVFGGLIISAFAEIGDVLKPKRFAGLFGAAPSVALATLALTIAADGKMYAAVEARSMLGGAAAFLAYAYCVSWIMMRHKHSAMLITILALPIWFTFAFGIWLVALR